MNPLYGIDISTYQGYPDFNKVKQGKQFVIIKASEGVGLKDPRFDQNRINARKAGLLCGFYHFARPDLGNSPEAEADYFIQAIGLEEQLQTGEILVLDIEVQHAPWNFKGDIVTWSKGFLDRIKSRLNGYKALVYTDLGSINTRNWKSVIDGDYGLWIALWDNEPNVVPTTQWPVIAMKQYVVLNCYGVEGDCDLDIFYGDEQTFMKYGYQRPIAVNPSIPTDQLEDAIKKQDSAKEEVKQAVEGHVEDIKNKIEDDKEKIAQKQAEIAQKVKEIEDMKKYLLQFSEKVKSEYSIETDVVFEIIKQEVKSRGVLEKWHAWVDKKFPNSQLIKSFLKYDWPWITFFIITFLTLLASTYQGTNPIILGVCTTTLSIAGFVLKFMSSNVDLDKNKDGKIDLKDTFTYEEMMKSRKAA